MCVLCVVLSCVCMCGVLFYLCECCVCSLQCLVCVVFVVCVLCLLSLVCVWCVWCVCAVYRMCVLSGICFAWYERVTKVIEHCGLWGLVGLVAFVGRITW